jgi:hypothetical protein
LLHYFCFKNIDANNYYCNEYIADHAAAVDDDYDEDYEDADVDGYVDGDNVQFQMLSINMLTMILMSKMITTAITHMPVLAFSRLPLQE